MSSSGLYAALAGLVGSNRSTDPNLARQPEVNWKFSPLMSWTTVEYGHVSRVGMTRPTPFPDRVGPKKSRAPNLLYVGPPRRAIRRHVLGFLRAPDREDDGNSHGCDPTSCGDAPALNENLRCVGVELEPPDKEGERLIDRPAPDHEPGRPELRLESQAPGGPFGRRPEKGDHDHRHEEQLAPEDFGCRHAQS